MLARIRSWLTALLFPRRGAREMAEEWAFHVDARIDDLMAAGQPRAAAERQAHREFGDPVRWREQSREARGVHVVDDLRLDVAYALRQMARAPVFTATAVLTLTLGIGATTAIFSVVNAVLLRPLAFPDSDRLVRIWSTMPAAGIPRSPSALPDYRAWREANHTFAEMAAYATWPYNATGGPRPERLNGVRTTASLWAVLGTRPALGTPFAADGETWGRHRVVIISHGLWQRWFGGRRDVIGRALSLDGDSYVVSAVMPASFVFPAPDVDLWTPLALPPGHPAETRSNHFLAVIGRVKPGVAMEAAAADLSVLAEAIAREVPENRGLGIDMVGWRDQLVGSVRRTLLLVAGAVGLLVALACMNVAGLLLARAVARRHELGVRLALGAGRSRLLRQLLVEGFVLAALGTALGLALALAVVRALPALAGAGIPRLDEVALDTTTLAFAAGLTILVTLACALWPARRAVAIDPLESLQAGRVSDRAHLRTRSLLVVMEVAVALVLLVGVSLLVASLLRVTQVDTGFRADHLLTMDLTLSEAKYPSPERTVAFVDEALARLAALPQASAVGITSALPLGDSEWGKYLTIVGRDAPPTVAQVPMVRYRQVTPGYFDALGARMRQGRRFTAGDRLRHPGVAIVNETAARRFWPAADPIGSRISLGVPEALAAPLLPRDFPGGIEGWRRQFPWLTIVGIVGDVRQQGPEHDAVAEVFVPYGQDAGEEPSPNVYLAMRTAGEPMALVAPIRDVIRALDPDQPIANVRTMEQRVAGTLVRRRFTLVLFGAFGASAVLLALIGLYGVLAYLVTGRRREFGIRTALGARPRDVSGLVVGHGMRLTAVGIVLGMAGAAVASQAISGLLFDVSAADPVSYASAATLLLVCALAACWLPSRRAARVDPIATLRES